MKHEEMKKNLSHNSFRVQNSNEMDYFIRSGELVCCTSKKMKNELGVFQITVSKKDLGQGPVFFGGIVDGLDKDISVWFYFAATTAVNRSYFM